MAAPAAMSAVWATPMTGAAEMPSATPKPAPTLTPVDAPPRALSLEVEPTGDVMDGSVNQPAVASRIIGNGVVDARRVRLDPIPDGQCHRRWVSTTSERGNDEQPRRCREPARVQAVMAVGLSWKGIDVSFKTARGLKRHGGSLGC